MSFVTFGEIMLRLTPNNPVEQLVSTTQMEVGYAGAESNVAASLSLLGNDTDFVSKLPKNPIGEAAINSLRRFGVSTRHVIRGGERIGTYFIENGSSIRPSRVIYDRSNSALAAIIGNEFEWISILKKKKWLHITGITLALSEQCAQECVDLAIRAREQGVKVSFDMNFRRSLWNDKSKARVIYTQIMNHTDLLFANLGALQDVFGLDFKGSSSILKTEKAIHKTQELFGISNHAFTIRELVSASLNTVSGMFLTENELHTSKSYCVNIVDRFGTGDAFAAGCLHAVNKGLNGRETIDFASAAFAIKHTIRGDINTSSEEEINNVAKGNIQGHIQR